MDIPLPGYHCFRLVSIIAPPQPNGFFECLLCVNIISRYLNPVQMRIKAPKSKQ